MFLSAAFFCTPVHVTCLSPICEPGIDYKMSPECFNEIIWVTSSASDGSQESSADCVSSNGEVQSCEYQWVTEGMPNGMACPEWLQSEVRI